MFTPKDVADYYNTTQNHYLKWWNLKKSLSLHYGIWDENTHSFSESLENTNRVLLSLASISKTDKVLDAGCGVGGAAFYVHTKTEASVQGISLSNKQIDFAQLKAKEFGLENDVAFHVMDYSDTSFKNGSFDVVWACESISSAPDKAAFIKEAYRLLKKGGRLILSDFFLAKDDQDDENNWMKKWGDTWGISTFISNSVFMQGFKKQGFEIQENRDYTNKITKSAKRLYIASLLGAIPSILYNLTHPNVSKFAKTHYLSGYYQYKALKEMLWEYHIILAIKK